VTSEDAATKRLIQPLALAESAAYVLIGIVFLAMTVETFWQLVRSVLIDINLGGNITAELVDSLNEALFVIILLELLSTVVNHLRKGGLQLRPFLVIGIVSSVRRILVLSAQLSVTRNAPSGPHLEELALDAGVVRVLTIALWISRLRPRPRRRSSPPARVVARPPLRRVAEPGSSSGLR
jgi:uncharacterized membrane protein (DUF373 family)